MQRKAETETRHPVTVQVYQVLGDSHISAPQSYAECPQKEEEAWGPCRWQGCDAPTPRLQLCVQDLPVKSTPPCNLHTENDVTQGARLTQTWAQGRSPRVQLQ